MANTGLFDFSRAEDLRLDEISMNSRTGYNSFATAVNGGTLPVNTLGTNWMNGFGTPVSTTPGAASTLTAAALSTGFIIQAPSAGNTSTFDTGANIVAMVNARSAGAVVGDVIQCLLINGSGANTITLAVPASGSFDTNQANRVIAVNTSRYVFLRLTNVTPGSEAYVVYF
jgi:hypothetical protein